MTKSNSMSGAPEMEVDMAMDIRNKLYAYGLSWQEVFPSNFCRRPEILSAKREIIQLLIEEYDLSPSLVSYLTGVNRSAVYQHWWRARDEVLAPADGHRERNKQYWLLRHHA